MRTYGRVTDEWGNKTWNVVQTDAKGANDYVYITTLAQCLLLFLGESPFWANFGIPSNTSLIQQVWPDYYVALTKQYFAQFFASLTVVKINNSAPTYNINVITNQGVKVAFSIPV